MVILVLESFGRESVGFFNRALERGSYKGYTPFLDSLLMHSFAYENEFATGRKSIDALPAVLAGIPAGEWSYVLTPYVSDSTESLPAILRKKGYHTSFFHGAPNGSMGFKAFLQLMGVEHYVGMDEYNDDRDFDGTWGIWDEPFLQYFSRCLDTFPQPFQATLFTVSSHEPFRVPQQYKGRFPKGDHPIREATGYTDMALQKFFDRARTRPWFKRTLFVITADHSSLTHHPDYQTAWGNMSIPILFYHPSDSLPGLQSGIAQQTDIMPTILSYLGYDKPFLSFGRNWFDTTATPLAVHYFGGGFQLVRGPYLLQSTGSQLSGLYNFKIDPQLRQNLLGTIGPIEKQMELTLKAFVQQYHARLIQNRLTAGAR